MILISLVLTESDILRPRCLGETVDEANELLELSELSELYELLELSEPSV